LLGGLPAGRPPPWVGARRLAAPNYSIPAQRSVITLNSLSRRTRAGDERTSLRVQGAREKLRRRRSISQTGCLGASPAHLKIIEALLYFLHLPIGFASYNGAAQPRLPTATCHKFTAATPTPAALLFKANAIRYCMHRQFPAAWTSPHIEPGAFRARIGIGIVLHALFGLFWRHKARKWPLTKHELFPSAMASHCHAMCFLFCPFFSAVLLFPLFQSMHCDAREPGQACACRACGLFRPRSPSLR